MLRKDRIVIQDYKSKKETPKVSSNKYAYTNQLTIISYILKKPPKWR